MQTGTELGGKDLLFKFGNGMAALAATFTTSTNIVGVTAHGLVLGQIVEFATVVTTTSLVANTPYYVAGTVTTNAFQVSATPGGTVIAIDMTGTGTTEEAFQTVGGTRDGSISLQSNGIDVTNHDSSQWKTLLDGAGISSAKMSGSGVYKDEIGIKVARDIFLNRQLRNWRIFTNKNNDYWNASFKVTAFDHGGNYDKEQTFSIALESSGPVTYVET